MFSSNGMQNERKFSHIPILDKDAHWMHYIITWNLSFARNNRIVQNISALWICYILSIYYLKTSNMYSLQQEYWNINFLSIYLYKCLCKAIYSFLTRIQFIFLFGRHELQMGRNKTLANDGINDMIMHATWYIFSREI